MALYFYSVKELYLGPLVINLLLHYPLQKQNLLQQLDQSQSDTTVIYCNNSSTINFSRNPVIHGRSKHINVQFHFLRDLTQDGTIKLDNC